MIMYRDSGRNRGVPIQEANIPHSDTLLLRNDISLLCIYSTLSPKCSRHLDNIRQILPKVFWGDFL